MASNADTPLTRDESLKRLQEQKTELEEVKGTIQNIISDLQEADSISGLRVLTEQLDDKRERLTAFITGLPVAEHVIKTAEDLRRATEPYLPPSWGIVDELRNGATSLMKIWDVVGERRPPRPQEDIPPVHRLDINEADHVNVTENLVEVIVRPEKTQRGESATTSDAAHLQRWETTGATGGQPAQIQHVERLMVSTYATVVNLQLGPISINSITDDKVVERAVQDVLITKIDWPEEIARAHRLTREKQRLTRRLNSELSQEEIEAEKKSAKAKLEDLKRRHQEEKTEERKKARRFLMKIEEEKIKLKRNILKRLRKNHSMCATIQELFNDFDVRLLGVGSGLSFLMDTPLEEWEEVKQKEQEIQDTVGKILLEGREVKWGKTTPFDHQAGIFDLHLGKALPIPETSDRVMAFNPLTATLQHTFCVDESQLKTQGDERRPWIRSLVMTEEGLIVMADFMNKKVKVMDSRTPRIVSSLSLRKEPWALAILHDHKVAVTSKDDNIIYLIDVTTKLPDGQRMKTARQYRGVGCGGKDGTLIVSCCTRNELPASVDVVSRDGQVVRTVVHGNVLHDLCEPKHLCVDGADILVSDCRADSVFRVDLATGQVKTTYGQLKCPYQVATDCSGNLYIVSFGLDCVLVVGVDGQRRTLLQGKESREGEPRSVAVTDTGIVVGWWSGTNGAAVMGYGLCGSL